VIPTAGLLLTRLSRRAGRTTIAGIRGSRVWPHSTVYTRDRAGYLDYLPEQGGKRPCGASEAYRELIELELSRGRNAMGIWQDLVDKHGFTSSYQSVQRFVLKLRGAVSRFLPMRDFTISAVSGETCTILYRFLYNQSTEREVEWAQGSVNLMDCATHSLNRASLRYTFPF